MSELLEECENCHQLFPESKISTHFSYCRRNIKKCPNCGLMYDINFQEDHDQEFHKKAICQFCHNQFPQAEIKKHEGSCPKRTEFCEYCKQNVPSAEYASHLRACEARTKPCEKCGKPITNKEYLGHIVSCPGYVEPERPKKNYSEFVDQQRNGFERSKQELPNDYYSGVWEQSNAGRFSYQEYMQEEIKKNQLRKETKNEDFYSKNRNENYPPVRPGISHTTQPTPVYQSNPNMYRQELERQEREKNSQRRNQGISNTTQSKGIGTKGTQLPPPVYQPNPSKRGVEMNQYTNPIKEAARVSSNQEQPKYGSKYEYTKNSQERSLGSNPSQARVAQSRQPKHDDPPARSSKPSFDDTDFEMDQHVEGLTDLELEEQRMIWESMMNQSKSKNAPKNHLNGFEGANLNESFYADADLERQSKIMEEIERNRYNKKQ